MIQKTSHYVSTSLKEAKTALKKGKVPRLSFLLYTLATIIGKGLFFTFPLFALADQRIVKQIREASRIDLDDALAEIDSSKNYRTIALGVLWNRLIALAGLIVIGGITILLYVATQQLLEYLPYFEFDWIAFYGVVGGLMAIGFLFGMSVSMDPVVFLVANDPFPGWADAQKQTRMLLNDAALTKLILIRLIHVLIFAIHFLVSSWIILLSYFSWPMAWSLMVSIPLLWHLFVALPRILLSSRLATVKFYLDLIEEASYQSLFEQTIEGLPTNKIRKEELLVRLFDETIVDAETLPEEDPLREVQ